VNLRCLCLYVWRGVGKGMIDCLGRATTRTCSSNMRNLRNQSGYMASELHLKVLIVSWVCDMLSHVWALLSVIG